MRVFCTIMVMIFLVAAVLMTVGCIVEWSGNCHACEEPHDACCNVLMRSRLFSIIATMMLWMCSVLWIMLLADKIKEENMEAFGMGTFDNYQTNMRNSMEKRR